MSNSIKRRVFVLFAILTFLISGITATTGSFGTAEAGSACQKVGWGLGQQSVGGAFQGAANKESPSRKWTAEELFRNSVGFSSYYGEGKSTWFYADTSERGDGKDGYAEVKSKLEENRGCATADFIPNTFFVLSSMATAITGSIVLTLVGKDEMADVLMKVIGGDKEVGNDGLITTFLSSFYMPLVVITVLIMAFIIVYKGLIQMKFREALNSAIWTIGAFVMGLALMLNPQILVSVPQGATSTITTCVMGALSGQNCLSGDIQAPSVLAGPECVSNVADGRDSESVVNSLNCTVWKSFILEPWAEVQFGAPYNELYTKSPPDGGSIWKNLPEGKGDNYCVNMTSSKSYKDSMVDGRPVMDGAKEEVCNVALYHLFVKTDMEDPVSQAGNNYKDGWTTDDTGSYDKRWYDIIIPAAGDSSTWRAWSGNGQFGAKIGTGIMGLIATLAAASVLLLLALFAGAYKIIGLVLMAFAPIFFLMAIDPSRGRRIFLGWLETLISSILKYFAITVLIIVALVMYSGMLANTSSVMSFVGIIILTVALHMYRKEITNLIGASNMGGQRLSNRAADLGGWAVNQGKQKGMAATGGTIGGAVGRIRGRNADVASRNETIADLKQKLEAATSEEDKQFYQDQMNNEKLLKKEAGGLVGAAVKGAVTGSASSVGRNLKRGNGIIANVAQQADRTKKAIDQERKEREKEGVKVREAYERSKADSINAAERDLASQKTTIPEGRHKDTNTNGKYRSHVNGNKEEVSKEEIKTNIDASYENIVKPSFYDDENLSEQEKAELDKVVDLVRESGISDTELVALMKNEEVIKDPNKQEIVSNEIKARMEAYNKLDIKNTPLDNATAVGKGLIENKEQANELNKFEADFINKISTKNNEEAIKAYKDVLYDAGLSNDEIFNSAQNLIIAHSENNLDIRDEILSDLNKHEVENVYDKAKQIAKETGEISDTVLKEKLGVDTEAADKILTAMYIDKEIGEIEAAEDGSYKAVVIPPAKDNQDPKDNQSSESKPAEPQNEEIKTPNENTREERREREERNQSSQSRSNAEQPNQSGQPEYNQEEINRKTEEEIKQREERTQAEQKRAEPQNEEIKTPNENTREERREREERNQSSQSRSNAEQPNQSGQPEYNQEEINRKTEEEIKQREERAQAEQKRAEERAYQRAEEQKAASEIQQPQSRKTSDDDPISKALDEMNEEYSKQKQNNATQSTEVNQENLTKEKVERSENVKMPNPDTINVQNTNSVNSEDEISVQRRTQTSVEEYNYDSLLDEFMNDDSSGDSEVDSNRDNRR